MKLQRTINRWTCLPASFGTVLGLTLEEVLARLGHDGSEVIFPELPDPERRRAFHPQELIDLADSLEIGVTPIEARPTSRPLVQGGRYVYPAYEVPLDVYPRFHRYMEAGVGVLTGRNLQNRPHAVVWDGSDVHDPASGDRFGPHLFQTEVFWRVTRRGAPLFLKIEGK